MKRARYLAGLTQVELAEKAGVNPSYLSELERGLRPGGIKAIRKIADALGLRVADLIIFDDGKPGDDGQRSGTAEVEPCG